MDAFTLLTVGAKFERRAIKKDLEVLKPRKIEAPVPAAAAAPGAFRYGDCASAAAQPCDDSNRSKSEHVDATTGASDRPKKKRKIQTGACPHASRPMHVALAVACPQRASC